VSLAVQIAPQKAYEAYSVKIALLMKLAPDW
jgi:hypothetical protein